HGRQEREGKEAEDVSGARRRRAGAARMRHGRGRRAEPRALTAPGSTGPAEMSYASAAMAKERIISADSHVNPPKDLWTRNPPANLRDRVPRVESTPQGDFWIVDAQISGAIGLDASAGRKPEDFKPMGLGYKDMRPGSYDPA